MSELVEQVARAIQDAHAPGHELSHVALYQARAALSVLEPRIEAAVMAERERCAGIADERASEWRRAITSGLHKIDVTKAEAEQSEIELQVISAAIRRGEG